MAGRVSNTLDNQAHQRSLKDFLTLYNTITEYCFNKCVSRFNERFASTDETRCVEVCTDNYVQYNQRFMFNFVDHQERRKRDAEKLAVETAAKAAEDVKTAVDTQQDAPSTATPESAGTSSTATSPATTNVSASHEERMQQAAMLLESMSSGSNPPASGGSGSEPLAVPLDSTKTLIISEPGKLKDRSVQDVTSQLQEMSSAVPSSSGTPIPPESANDSSSLKK